MKRNKDINDSVITFEVDKAVIDGVLHGEIRELTLSLNEDNQDMVIETVEGCPVISVEEAPPVYRSCFLYNGGVFPYLLKRSLRFIVLEAGKEHCALHIVRTTTQPGTRFIFQKTDAPALEDPDGDCCVWVLHYDIVPVPEKPKTYLMRWNPAISSFTEQDYRRCVEHQEDDTFFLNWSIYEWEEVNRGDAFYMLRTGDEGAGIVFNGYFISNPYTGDDWKGTGRRRCYVDMACRNAAHPDAAPMIPLKVLKEAIPSVDWEKGHSGELLSDDVADVILKLLREGNSTE